MDLLVEFRHSRTDRPAASKNHCAGDKEHNDPTNLRQAKSLDALVATISEEITHVASRLFTCAHDLSQNVCNYINITL
ncbi:MAG: hypothetical protein CR217_12800 [Beijerinckiaceae bacterium]|nr:MAG: hypothetical protein CR217_12800 [Beijerinckiaceae bacterium]